MADGYVDRFLKALKNNTAFIFQQLRTEPDGDSLLHYLHDKRIQSLEEPFRSYKALYNNLWKRGSEAMEVIGIFSSIELDPGGKLGDGKGGATDVEIIDLSIAGFRRDFTTPFPSQFLVRDEYKSLWKIMKPNNGYNYLVSGNPGIGKSWYLMYVLIQRLTEGKPTIYAPNVESWYLFHSTGVYAFDQSHMTSLDTLVERWCTTSPHPHLAEEEGMILFDCDPSQPFPTFDASHWRESWRNIVASSPRHTSYSAFMERWPLTAVCGMMLWSWHEIVAANPTQLPHSQRTIEELWELFSRYGPTPRIAYITSPASNEAKLFNAIKRCKGNDIIFASPDVDVSDASRFLLVTEPRKASRGRISRRNLITRFATNYIAEAVVENATTTARNDLLYPLRDYLNEMLTNDYKKYLADMLFRAAAHRCMNGRQGRDQRRIYTLRPLDRTRYTEQLTLDIDREFVFDDVEQLRGQPDGIYFRPAQERFPAVDGVTFVDGRPIVFRYTTSYACPIDIDGFNRLAKAISWADWTYVFVVPNANDMEETFTSQTIRGVGLTTWKSKITQYVTALDVEDLFPLVKPAATAPKMRSGKAIKHRQVHFEETNEEGPPAKRLRSKSRVRDTTVEQPKHVVSRRGRERKVRRRRKSF